MKNVLTIVSTLGLGFALTLTACGKDKKPAAADPAAAAPAAPAAAADPAKPDPAAPAAADPAKADDKPKAGGW